MCVYIFAHIYRYMYTSMIISRHTDVCIYICMYIYIVYVYICTPIRMLNYTQYDNHVYVYTYIYVYLYIYI